jgi:hypothetical protein
MPWLVATSRDSSNQVQIPGCTMFSVSAQQAQPHLFATHDNSQHVQGTTTTTTTIHTTCSSSTCTTKHPQPLAGQECAVHRLQDLHKAKSAKQGRSAGLCAQLPHVTTYHQLIQQQRSADSWLHNAQRISTAGQPHLFAIRDNSQHVQGTTTTYTTTTTTSSSTCTIKHPQLLAGQECAVHGLQDFNDVCEAGPLRRVVRHARSRQQRQRQGSLWRECQLALVGAHSLNDGAVWQPCPRVAASDHLQ